MPPSDHPSLPPCVPEANVDHLPHDLRNAPFQPSNCHLSSISTYLLAPIFQIPSFFAQQPSKAIPKAHPKPLQPSQPALAAPPPPPCLTTEPIQQKQPTSSAPQPSPHLSLAPHHMSPNVTHSPSWLVSASLNPPLKPPAWTPSPRILSISKSARTRLPHSHSSRRPSVAPPT